MAYALAVWTLLVWATRIRIVLRQGAHASDLVLPVALTALAIFALVNRRQGVRVLVVATALVWAVRLPLVLAHHHTVAFKVVHAGLAIVSLALAVLSWRAVSRSGGSCRWGPRPRRSSARA